MTDHQRGIEAAVAAYEHDGKYALIVNRFEAAISAYLATTEPGKPESGVLAEAPDGYVIVPIEPTEEMIKAADVAGVKAWRTGERMAAAMLSAGIRSALTTPPQPVEAHKKLELWFFRDMFESNRLALFSLFGFKAEQVDTMAKQRISFRHILRNEGAK
jgi:hypothetical protein